jgi:hypothetical protein
VVLVAAMVALCVKMMSMTTGMKMLLPQQLRIFSILHDDPWLYGVVF